MRILDVLLDPAQNLIGGTKSVDFYQFEFFSLILVHVHRPLAYNMTENATNLSFVLSFMDLSNLTDLPIFASQI